jgi:hypothetical protein
VDSFIYCAAFHLLCCVSCEALRFISRVSSGVCCVTLRRQRLSLI